MAKERGFGMRGKTSAMARQHPRLGDEPVRLARADFALAAVGRQPAEASVS